MVAPKLRFKEFTEEWNKDKLKNICVINPRCNNLPQKFYYIDLESVVEGKLVKKINIINKKDAPSRAQRLLKNNDILYQTVRPYQKNNYYFNNEKETKSVASTGYAQIRVNINDPRFVYQLLYTNKFVKMVLVRCTGTSYPAINSTDLGMIETYYPSVFEQEKIADFLSTVDRKIESQENVINYLENTKKGLIKKIFRKEIRFKDDDGNEFPKWEDKKVCDLFTLTRGRVIPKNEIKPNPTDEYIYPVYSSQTTNEGILGYERIFDFEGNYITWTTDGANAGKVFTRKGKFNCTNVCGVLVEKEKTKGFANYCISEMLNEITYKYVSYVGNPKLMNKVMAEIPLKVPSVLEQVKIANFISKMNDKIESEKNILGYWKNIKKGLLQQMFV